MLVLLIGMHATLFCPIGTLTETAMRVACLQLCQSVRCVTIQAYLISVQ